MTLTNKEFETFQKLCKQYFDFLRLEYNCKFSIEKKDYGAYAMYQNSTTGIKVNYVPRDAGIVYVFIARLINGSFPERPIHVEPATKLQSFDLEDLISKKDPSLKIERPTFETLSKPFTVDVFEQTFKQLANALKKYGNEVLKGDFNIFSELEKIVKRRQH